MPYWIVYEWANGRPNRDAYLIVRSDDAEQAEQHILAAMTVEAGRQPELEARFLQVVNDPHHVPDDDPRTVDVREQPNWYLHMEVQDCPVCAGVGWIWGPPAIVEPSLPAKWSLCPPCNGTGLRHFHATTPRQPRPAESPS